MHYIGLGRTSTGQIQVTPTCVVGDTCRVNNVANRTMSIAAAARRLGVSRAAIRRMRDDDVLVTITVRGRGVLLASSVEQAAAERERMQDGRAALVAALVDAGLYER